MKHMATIGAKSRTIKVGKKRWPTWPVSYKESKPGEVPTDTKGQRKASTKVVGGVKFTSVRGRTPFEEYGPYTDGKYREQFSAVIDGKTIYMVGDRFGSSRRIERLDGRGTEVVFRWSNSLDKALQVSKSKQREVIIKAD